MASEIRSRNYPPEHGIIVPVAHQGEVIRSLLGTPPMRSSDADFLAEVLLANDVRCLYSHGSRQLPHYLENLNNGNVNPEPKVEVVSDFGATAVVDGDGGMGHTTCRVGMGVGLDKTRQFGVGACTTGNHFHFGSAGTWTRMAVEQGYIGMAMSDSRTKIDVKRTVMGLVRSSPLSLGFPAGEQPPLILDGSGSMLPGDEGLMQSMPHAYFKALGLSAAIQTFSGILAGINRPALIPPTSKWVSNQGSFLCAWDVSRFMDMEEFTAEMDGYIRKVRSMRPFPGTDRAELPGGLEWQWERENRAKGIPLGDEHRKELEGLAAGAGVECGYEAFEDSRF